MTKKLYLPNPNWLNPGTIRLSRSPLTVTVFRIVLRNAPVTTKDAVCRPNKQCGGIGAWKKKQEQDIGHWSKVRAQVQVLEQQKLKCQKKQETQDIFQVVIHSASSISMSVTLRRSSAPLKETTLT